MNEPRKTSRDATLPLPRSWHGTAVTGLFVLASLAALAAAKTLLFPIVLAAMLNFVLRVPVSWLRRMRCPKPVGAALVLLLVVGGLAFAVNGLRDPAMEWLGNAPRTLQGVERKVRDLREPVERMSRAAAQVEEMTNVEGQQKKQRGVQQVAVQQPTLLETVVQKLPELIASTVVTLVLLFLLLVFDEDLLSGLVKAVPSVEEKRRVVEIARRAESTISRYLLTITSINAALGAAIGFALLHLGVPNPWLWGAMAGILNYVPYLGGVVGVSIVAIVALATLDSPLHALAAPAVYTVLNVLEGLVLTPIVLGRRFSLNPVIIFVWLLLWGWLWGIAGALIAVPLLTVFKIVCDATPSLRRIGTVLGRGV